MSTADILIEPNFDAPVDSRNRAESLATRPFADSVFTAEAHAKVKRLARFMLPFVSRPGCRTLAFGEVGFSHKLSAAWLTAGVAMALGATLDEPFHVLILEDTLKPEGPISAMQPMPGVVIERLQLNRCSPAASTGALEQRINELRSEKRKVLLHLSEAQRQLDLVSSSEKLAGLVLLARASHARKAALEAIQLRLEQLEVPLLGAVLLDRTYPIPEILYRLL